MAADVKPQRPESGSAADGGEDDVRSEAEGHGDIHLYVYYNMSYISITICHVYNDML
jgi:hypothetical protein